MQNTPNQTQPNYKAGLRPGEGKYIELKGNKKDLVKQHLPKIREMVSEAKKLREEKGYTARNKPVVYTALIDKNAHGVGPREG